MKQVTKRKIFNISFESIFFLASFLLPFLLLIIIFSNNGFALNFLEGNTIISIDFQSQYIVYGSQQHFPLGNLEI